jgi:glutaminyl-peptide cyclotransferase
MPGSSRLAEAAAVALGAGALLLLAGSSLAAERAAAPVFGYSVLAAWPHDPRAFTEGLALDGGILYESTGRASTLREVEPRSGRVIRSRRLQKRYFGEGATVVRGRVYQLTWTQRTAFVYDAGTLRRLRTVRYAGETWGLTHYGNRLVISDGTPVVRFVDRTTFATRRRLTVRNDQGAPVAGLNELELVAGAICANVFPTDRVACFDPVSGRVDYWIDLTGLLPPNLQPGDEEATANGVAYAGRPRRLIVTGKLWPRVFEIRLVRKS